MGNGVGVVVGDAVRGAPGRQVVVILSHATQAPAGFRRMSRDELARAITDARTEASRSGTAQVVLVHVPNDVAVPPTVAREADVVLVVAKARHG